MLSTETVHKKEQTNSYVVDRNTTKKRKQTLMLSTEPLHRKEQTDYGVVERNSVQKEALNGL